MNTLAQIAIRQFLLFTLIVTRVTGLMIFAPFFGSNAIPRRIRVMLSVFMSLAIFPMVPTTSTEMPDRMLTYIRLVGGELAIGLIVGFGATLVFLGFQLAGQMIGQQMGIALANVINPQLDQQVSLMGQFYFTLALTLFVLVGGHRMLAGALLDSFRSIPLTQVTLTSNVYAILMALSQQIFVVAVKVGAPALVAMVMVSVAMGFVARTVPQLNILVIGFPLRVCLAFLIVLISLPSAGSVFGEEFVAMADAVGRLIEAMAGTL